MLHKSRPWEEANDLNRNHGKGELNQMFHRVSARMAFRDAEKIFAEKFRPTTLH